jgi:outer membrane protein assembly complex protein YaeT
MNLLNIRVGDYLIARNLEDASKRVIDFYKNSGYPYISLEQDTVIKDSQADIYFSIQEGPLSYIKEIRVRGNLTVKTWTIIRASEIKPGEKFSQERLYQAQRRLYATRLFSRVSFYVQGIEEKKESLSVRFDVSELPARSFTFGLGYQLPPSRFLFALGWEHLNILNRGQNLSIASEFTPNFRGDYELNLEAIYKVPYLIRMPLNFTTKPFFNLVRQQKNYSTELGLETGINRYLGANWEINLSNRYRKRIFKYADSLIIDSTTRRGITNSIIFNLTYDSRNSFFNPSRGLYLSPIIEVAGGILGGDNDFNRTSVEFRAFQSIFEILIFGFRGLFGISFPYGQTAVIPYYEKFYIGGRNTLRGYDEKSVGTLIIGNEHYGNYIINTNFELRTIFYKNFGLVLFFDGGDVTDKIGDFKLSNYQYSIGLGIRFNTPVGPIRLDYGKCLKNPEPNDRGRLYLGLLHAF